MVALAVALFFAQPLLIRRAEVDITPPEPLPLGGYTERHGKLMQPGGDPLYARCLELEQGNTKVAIVSVEMLTIPESLVREVAARIPKNVHLFMQATHTHCAPDSQMLNDRMTFTIPGIASYRKRWLTWYAEKIAGVVDEAATQAPSEVSRLDEDTSIVAANRSRRKGGKPDPTFTKVKAIGAVPPMLFSHFSAHPTIYGSDELRTRGDWPGVLAKETGALVLNGALGDVSPVADGATVEEKFLNFRQELASTDKAQTVTVWSPTSDPRSRRSLEWTSQPIRLDRKKPHPTFAKTNGIPQALAQSLTNQFAPSSGQICAIRVGTLAVVGVPGEPTSILGNQIKDAGLKMGFKSVLVCSHVNGWIGYILDPSDYDRGGYEASLSFYGRGEGRNVVAAGIAALKNLR